MAPANLGFRTVLAALLCLLAALPAVGQNRSAASKKPAAKPKAAAPDPFGADSITLADGKTLLGQIYDGTPRGGMIVIVRRAWAEEKLPDWAAKWSKLEAVGNAGADAQRRARLAAWRRDRPATPTPDDRITAWLDRELAKPVGPGEPSVLTVARLGRGDVKTVQRRGKVATRSLRLGWTLGLKDVETMPLAELKDALEGRGLAATGDGPIPLDALLPPLLETDAQWSLRRAATEVGFDEGTRFIRFGSTVMPEPAPGRPPDPSTAGALLASTLKDLLGEPQADPLTARLNDMAAKGRAGAIVTRLDLAADMSSVTVESTLYVRGPGGWTRGASRSGTLQTGDVGPGAVQEIAGDPQIQSAFGLVDSLGFGQVSGEMKQKGLLVGATTKRALGMSRSALARDLAEVALPIAEPATKAPTSKDKP